MDGNRQSDNGPSLPAYARSPFNRCNLPAVILGSLTYQQHPLPLHIDGVEELHAALFRSIDKVDDPKERSEHFKHYMRSGFLLGHLDKAGFDPSSKKRGRDKADYLRILRGWLFDPDGKEAAVLKGWVESRFGLLPRNHNGPLGDMNNERYTAYLTARSRGLYNTNALEAQLDLLYTYCQYELRRQYPNRTHFELFRGVNRVEEHEVLARPDKKTYMLLLNNLNSFTGERERADEFGDYIMKASLPVSKLLYMPGLLPGTLRGEKEYLVIGGVYEVRLGVL
ncbi:MAG: NAD(+)--dinitrogen-reductase ADP-D-ribosyltransferase [Candidatus Sedimenticola endophacoides]